MCGKVLMAARRHEAGMDAARSVCMAGTLVTVGVALCFRSRRVMLG